MDEPLVSVIIPCYNVSDYVKEAIDSIIYQTYKNLEIWLIDDASIDNTRFILDSYNDHRIKKYYVDKNSHKIGAVNNVLSMVGGKFICFQDADDYSEINRIQKQVDFLCNNPEKKICFTGFKYFGDLTRNAQNISITSDQISDEFLNYKSKKDVGKDATCCPSMMISSDILKFEKGYHPYFVGRVAEDAHWIYRILKLTQGGCINEILYSYRVRNGSFTGQQMKGENAKFSYSWNLLSRIIQKDIHENVDLLSEENKELLKLTELEACEEALLESISNCKQIQNMYSKSMSYKLGKFILSPIRYFSQLSDYLTDKKYINYN